MNATFLKYTLFTGLASLLLSFPLEVDAQKEQLLDIPLLSSEPLIDGDPSEWKNDAFDDGTWTLDRVQQSPWYHPKRNRLVRHAMEDSADLELEVNYFLAWRGNALYLGAEVRDNVLDLMDTLHEPKRWYYKDAIAFFFEAPKDSISEKFGEGDHGFCFVMDETLPDYGAWWRHGSEHNPYIEERLPARSVKYSVFTREQPDGTMTYSFEARVDLELTFGSGHPMVSRPGFDHVYGGMIVHCDPDGGEYGGHLLIYGKGDDDATWGAWRFVE